MIKKAVPSLPVSDIENARDFYEAKFGFLCHYKDEEFAKFVRDEVEIHLWKSGDNSWRYRSFLLFFRPVWSGAESFLAGTASCRLEVSDIEDLFQEFKKNGVLYSSDTVIGETAWSTREFPILDQDRNLITIYQPIGNNTHYNS